MMRRRTIIWIAALAIIILVATFITGHHLRWRVWMQIRRIPQMDHMPLETAGYTIEKLPFGFAASFARGHDVYFADPKGRIFQVDDRSPLDSVRPIGESNIAPRMIFVSSDKTIFVSGNDLPLLRSTDGGKNWEKSHDWSFWRMTEDEEHHIVYAGNYSRQRHPPFMAKLFKSVDEGKTWQTIFQDEQLDHIHSVAWDANYGILYLTAGDTRHRGQAYSSDYGKTWRWLNTGGKQGHTDIAISEHYVFWGTDDNLGRILRAPRKPVEDGHPILWQPYHHVWWIVVQGTQIYAGTLTGEGKMRNTGAFLMASADEGETWQRLLEESDEKSPVDAFYGESRHLSADGWLYCTTSGGKTYRIRRSFNALPTPAR